MFRDISQLREAPKFGITAVEGLLTVESALQEALPFVPFCDEHLPVWSSRFTRIILEAASQVDSVWKATVNSDKELNIKHHYNTFGKLVAGQKVVFFGGATPYLVHPFEEWLDPEWLNRCGSKRIPWWKAYTDLKHDRFANQKEATLKHAVSSVAALLLAIIYSGSCDVALLSAKLLGVSSYNPWAFTDTGLIRDISGECTAKVETRLFAHPLGVFDSDERYLRKYWVSDSPRFDLWWTLLQVEGSEQRSGSGRAGRQ